MATTITDQMKKNLRKSQVNKLVQLQNQYSNLNADERVEVQMQNEDLIRQQRQFLQNRGLAGSGYGNGYHSGVEAAGVRQREQSFAGYNQQLNNAEQSALEASAQSMRNANARAAALKAQQEAAAKAADNYKTSLINENNIVADLNHMFEVSYQDAIGRATNEARQVASSAQATAKAKLSTEDYNRMQSELKRAGLTGYDAEVARINAANMAMSGAAQTGNLKVNRNSENEMRWQAESARIAAQQKQTYLNSSDVYTEAVANIRVAKETMQNSENRMSEFERQMETIQGNDIISQADFNKLNSMNEEWLKEQENYAQAQQLYEESVRNKLIVEASYDTILEDQKYIEEYSKYSDEELEAMAKEADRNAIWSRFGQMGLSSEMPGARLEDYEPEAGERVTNANASLLNRLLSYRKLNLLDNSEAWSSSMEEHATAEGYTGDWRDYKFDDGADSVYYRAVVDTDVISEINEVFRRSYDSNIPSRDPDVMKAIGDHTSYEKDFFYAEYAAFMEQEEKQTFLDLYQNQGATAADKYFEALMLRLDDRAAQQVSDEAHAAAEADGFLPTFLKSVGVNFSKAISGPLDNIYYSARGYGVTKTQAYRNDYAQLMREAITPEGYWGSLVVGTGMSMADSTVAAILSKAVPGLGGVMLGSSAYNSALREAYDRGITGTRAQATAVMAGVNEMLFEEISLEKLNKIRETGVKKEMILNALKQALNEGSEEFCTDVANAYADYLINGGQAELMSMYNEMLQAGYSKDQAGAKVVEDFSFQLLTSFLGGAISGGLMGGGAQVAQNTAAKMTQSGNASIKALGNALLNTGNRYLEVATAEQLEERGAQIRKDASFVAELEGHEYMNDETNDLAADPNKNNVELARLEQQYKYEEGVAKQTQGINDTDGARQNLLDRTYNDTDAQEIVRNAGGNVENLNNQEVAQLYAARAYEDLAPANEYLQDAKTGSIVAIQSMVTGNQITEKQAETIAQDASGVAALEQITGTKLARDGQYKVSAADVMAAANAKASEVAQQYGTMEVQNDVVQARVEKAVKKIQKEQAEYQKGAERAEKQRSPFMNKQSVVSGDDKTQTITASGGNTVKIMLREGSVRYLSEQAKSVIDVCRILAEADPELNIIVRDTFEDENTSLDETPNGKYYGNTIEIALNSSDSLAYTVMHEFTHHLEAVSPEAFAVFKNVVINQVNSDDMSRIHSDVKLIIEEARKADPNISAWDALVNHKLAEYRQDASVQAEEERTGNRFEFEDAEKEVLADIGTRMINEKKVQDALAEETGLKTARTIRDWFRNLKWNIENLIHGQEMTPKEVQFLEQSAKGYGEIADAYAKLIQETSRKRMEKAAARARAEAEAADPVNQEFQGDDTVRNSIRSFSHAAGIMAVKDKKTGVITFKIDGENVDHVTADHIKRSGIGALITYAATETETKKATISKEEADIQYQAAADIMNMIMNTQNPEMVWAYTGSTLFSALKSNADGQYGTTIDFTTVCRKTQEMITAMSEAMIKLGRGLTRQEVTELQGRLNNAGSEVPCPVCYVFSRWAGIGSVLDKIRDAQERFDPSKVNDAALRTRVSELTAEINKRKLIKVDGKNQTQTQALNQLKEETDQELEAVRAALSALDTEYDSLSRSRERLQMKNGSSEEENVSLSELQKRLEELENDRDILGEYVWLKDVRMQKDYTPVDMNVLYDLDNAAEFSSRWPAAWKYRTTRGPATGKAILPYSDMRLGDMILGVKSNSATGNKKFAEVKDGEFNAQQKRAITTAIARTRAQNLIGGQRFQSTSDFRYEYALDYLQTFWEMQALGSKLQTYTKVIEFADMIAAVGGDVNLSVMPRGKGYQGNVLDFSSKTGINVNAAREANAKYDNVQLILVGINDQHIMLALEDSTETGGADIGFVIPWHASGANAEFTAALVENLGEEYTRKNYQNYEAVQTDHVKADRTDLQQDRADLRKYILTAATSGKNKFKLSEAQLQWMRNEAARKTDILGRSFEELRDIEQRALAENPDPEAVREYESWTSDALLNLYEKMRTEGGSEYGVKLSSTQAGAVMPHEYWNKNTTRENAYINGFLFRSYCYNLGLHPRFTGMTSSGSKVDYGDFSSSKGYWKTLIDRPMYRNAENGGTYREQQQINVTGFDSSMLKPEYAERVYPDYKIQEPNKARAKSVGKEYAAAKQFEIRKPAEVVQKDGQRELLAMHNLSLRALFDALSGKNHTDVEGLMSACVAILMRDQTYGEFGLCSVVMPSKYIDPETIGRLRVYAGDAWTGTFGAGKSVDNDFAKRKIQDQADELYRIDEEGKRRYLVKHYNEHKGREGRNKLEINPFAAAYQKQFRSLEEVQAEKEKLRYFSKYRKDFAKYGGIDGEGKAVNGLNNDINEARNAVATSLNGGIAEGKDAMSDDNSWTSKVTDIMLDVASTQGDSASLAKRFVELGMNADEAAEHAGKIYDLFMQGASLPTNYFEAKLYNVQPVSNDMVVLLPTAETIPLDAFKGKTDEEKSNALQAAKEVIPKIKEALAGNGIMYAEYDVAADDDRALNARTLLNRNEALNKLVDSFEEKHPDSPLRFQTRSRAQMQHQVDSEVAKLSDEDLDSFIFTGEDRERYKLMYQFNPVERVLDKVAGDNPEFRQKLYEMIERPFNMAGGNYARGRNAMAGALTEKMKELGITKMSESAAIQHYGEGTKEFKGHVVPKRVPGGKYKITLTDQQGNFVKEMTLTRAEVLRGFYIDGEEILSVAHADPSAEGPKQVDVNYIPYTLNMLKEDCPGNWEKIIEAEQYIRKMYKGYIQKINKMLERVYPWVYESDEQTETALEEKLDLAKKTVTDQITLIARLEEAAKQVQKEVQDTESQRVKSKNQEANAQIKAQKQLIADMTRKLKEKRRHYEARKSKVSQAAADEAAQIQRLDARLQVLQLRLEQLEESKKTFYPRDQKTVNADAAVRKAESRANAAKAKLLQLEANVAVAEAKLADFKEARKNGDTVRNKRLLPRDNYFHHFRELQSELGSIQHILRMNTSIDPALATKSDETKPRGKWTNFLQQRRGGKYRADAINGAYLYIANAEYILAYDPVIAEMRDLHKALETRAHKLNESKSKMDNEGSTNKNEFLIWLHNWTNNLAGKSDDLDRMIANKIGTRKVMQLLSAINGRVAKAKLLFNVRSAGVQMSNMTNVMMYVDAQDWGKAFLNAINMGHNDDLKAIFGRSNFVTQRLMENPEFKEEHVVNPMKFAEWMLGALDRVSSTVSWWAAYNQYGRIGAEAAAKKGYRQYDSAADYADDIVRRTHGGRGIGEIPLVLKSKTVTAFAPFQVEVLNTYQNLMQQLGKEQKAKEKALGIVKMQVGIFAFNAAFRLLFGDGVLGFDFIHALIAIMKKWLDPDDDDSAKDKLLYTSREILGEFVAGVPFAAQITSMLVPDSGLREWLFGEDQDPTRYGTGTLGLSALSSGFKIAKNAFEGKNVFWDVADTTVGNFMPGGAQLVRTGKGMETFFRGYGQSNTGRVQFAVDQSPLEFIQMLLFGKWSTPEAREYLDSLDPVTDFFYQESGFKLLDDKKSDAYKQFVKAGGKGKDFFKLVSQCNGVESDKDANGKAIEGTAAVKKLAVIDSYKLGTELREQMARMYVISDTKAEYLDRFKAAGGKSDDFIDILAEYVVMTSDKNADGKAISGSKKKKYEALLDQYNLTNAQHDVLMDMYK